MRLKRNSRWEDECVSLFQLEPSHVSDAYLGWLADSQINRYLESRFSSHDRASVEAFVRSMIESPNNILFGIHDRRLNRHVGNIKLGPIDRHHGVGEIGIMIGDCAAWGRGIGSSAISRIVEIATHDLGLRKLSAGCYATNVGSKRAFEKAGFAIEAVRTAHYLLDGQPEDAVLLGKLIH